LWPDIWTGYFRSGPDIPATLKKWLRIKRAHDARQPDWWPDIPAGYFKSGPDIPATPEIG
jgi:hypothetical protein